MKPLTRWAVRINGRWSGDDETTYVWKRKKDAIDHMIFLHAGEVVKVTITDPPADDVGGER
jgi:hypothetical protein